MAGANYVRLDVDYYTNPKAIEVGAAGRAAHLASICWVGRHLTDGRIPAQVIPVILRAAEAPRATTELLIEAGLWVPNGGASFELHDYLEIGNRSREQVERERERWRRAKRKKDE